MYIHIYLVLLYVYYIYMNRVWRSGFRIMYVHICYMYVYTHIQATWKTWRLCARTRLCVERESNERECVFQCVYRDCAHARVVCVKRECNKGDCAHARVCMYRECVSRESVSFSVCTETVFGEIRI